MAKFIEADVIQKIATEAEWLTQTRIPYKGQIMIVSDSSGKVTNIKVGDGVNPFADLNYMFDSIQQNASFVPTIGNTLPTPSVNPAFTILGDGDYGSIPADEGNMRIATWDGSAWTVASTVEIPIQEGTDVLDPELIPKGKAVERYVKPLFDLTFVSTNKANKDDIVSGRVNEFGVINNSLNWINITIKNLKKNTQYTINQQDIIASSNPKIVFLDLNNEVISVVMSNELTTPLTFTTPNEEDFITKINIANEIDIGLNPTDNIFANNLMLNEGDTLLPYESYKILIDTNSIDYDFDDIAKESTLTKVREVTDIFDVTPSLNLIDKSSDIVSGQYVYNSSTNTIDINSSLNWIRLLPKEIDGGTYTLQGVRPFGTPTSGNVRIFFTDLSDNLISYLTGEDTGSTSSFTFTTPWSSGQSGKIGVNIANLVGIGNNPSNNEYSNILMLSVGAGEKPYEPYGENITLDAQHVRNIPSSTDLGKILIDKTTPTSMTIYWYTGGNTNNWIGVNFRKFENPSRFIDFWRIDVAKHYLKTGVSSFTEVSEIVQTGVWENAIYTNEPEYDNALGSSHGWEMMTDIEMKIDGAPFDMDSIGNFSCNKIEINQSSNLVTADGSATRATSVKKWVFEQGNINIDNQITWLMATSISERSFVAMLPINRDYNGVNITNRAMRNTEWVLYDVSQTGFSNPLNSQKINNSDYMFAEGLKYVAEMKVQATPNLVGRGFWMQNTSLYNKMYFQLGETNVEPSDVWNIKAEYNIRIK